jgi:hypothetical protein
MNATTNQTSKTTLCDMVRKFIDQRSGMDFREYGNDRAAFMSDYRPMLRNGRDARRLLAFVEGREDITADDILTTTSGNGRLEFFYAGGGVRLEYTTGQYFPTEYRAAACSMLAILAWQALDRDLGDTDPENGAADAIRRRAGRIFGRGIASRFFS